MKNDPLIYTRGNDGSALSGIAAPPAGHHAIKQPRKHTKCHIRLGELIAMSESGKPPVFGMPFSEILTHVWFDGFTSGVASGFLVKPLTLRPMNSSAQRSGRPNCVPRSRLRSRTGCAASWNM